MVNYFAQLGVMEHVRTLKRMGKDQIFLNPWNGADIHTYTRNMVIHRCYKEFLYLSSTALTTFLVNNELKNSNCNFSGAYENE